jgi:hypothetical protein
VILILTNLQLAKKVFECEKEDDGTAMIATHNVTILITQNPLS